MMFCAIKLYLDLVIYKLFQWMAYILNNHIIGLIYIKSFILVSHYM